MKYITRGIDLLYDEFDPRLFVNNSGLYIEKLFERVWKNLKWQKKNEAQFKSFDEDIKIFFDELCDSNGNINTENEEKFKKSQKKWFDGEFKRSLIQAATVPDKVFPTDQPDKELLIKTAYEIMEFKVEQLEKILKNKR